MDVDQVSRIIRKRKIKKLPIIEDGHLVGLVTTTEIARSPEVTKMIIKSTKET